MPEEAPEPPADPKAIVHRLESLPTRGGIVMGPAGSGKTTKLVALYKDLVAAGKRVAVLTPTNAAKRNLRARGITQAVTIDKYYGKVKGQNVRIDVLKACAEDVILVDEFSMVAYDWFHVFMQAKRKSNVKFVFFGDPNQCDGVEDYKCKVVATSVMRYLAGYNIVDLPYIAATGRYTEETKTELDKLLKYGTWSHYQEHWALDDQEGLPFNVVYTNRLRRKLNERACDIFCAALEPDQIVEIGNRKFAAGMPIVCFENNVVADNNDMFTITGFKTGQAGEVEAVTVRRGRAGKTVVEIEAKWFSRKTGENYVFEHYWAGTVNRVQGLTLQGKYNVHEIKLMPLNHLYTALSRTVDYRLVAVGRDLSAEGHVWHEKPVSGCYTTRPVAADRRGVIYRIDDGKKWYVGKTEVRDKETYESAAARRFKEHKTRATCDKMREWLAASKDQAKCSVVKSGYFASDYQLDQFETLVLTWGSIARETGCMNTQKTVGIAPEVKVGRLGNEAAVIAKCTVGIEKSQPKGEKAKVTFDSLVKAGAIKVDPKKKRYRISYIDGGKTKRKEVYYRDETRVAVQNVAVDFYTTVTSVT